MIEIRRIGSEADPLLPPLLAIYGEAFPPAERRSEAQLLRLIACEPRMAFNALLLDGVPVGLLAYWAFDGFHYLEHLAVRHDLRCRHIGSEVLDWIEANLPGLRLLEAEPACPSGNASADDVDYELASRRIAYYGRHGYRVLERSYVQRSYSHDADACPLWILGSAPDAELDRHIATIKREAYLRPLSL